MNRFILDIKKKVHVNKYSKVTTTITYKLNIMIIYILIGNICVQYKMGNTTNKIGYNR